MIFSGSLYLQFPDENEGMNVQWTIGMEKTIEINGVKFYKDWVKHRTKTDKII